MHVLRSGFTLIEILVTIAVLGIVVVLIGNFSGDTFFLSNMFQSSLNMADEARRIIRPMANEIRSASPSASGAFSIETATDTTFTFFSDIDNDTVPERVRYFLNGTIIQKGVTEPVGIPALYPDEDEIITDVIHGIQNGALPIFEYYDTNYNGLTTPLIQPVTTSDVRLIKIIFIIDTDVNRPPAETTITTQVSLRNLKDNL